MKTMKMMLPVVMLLGLFAGCKKSDSITDPGTIPGAAQAVYVVNEGNFGKGNASLSMYIPDSGKVFQDVFTSVNQRSLGDVGNDFVVYGKYAYIVVNNSQKIEVVTLETMKSAGTITIPGPDAKSPFKVAIYSSTKGYVTNLYDNSVTVFNPTTFAIVKERIPVGMNPQGIVAYNDKLYVCNSGYGADSTVSVIDPLTDTVVKTIVVGKQPSEIGVSSAGKLIVRCEGVGSYPDPQKESAGSIVRIDPATQTVTATLPLPLANYDHPTKMAVSVHGFAYVKVSSGIMKVETNTLTIAKEAFIPFSSWSINGMAYDDTKDRLYVADAVDYVSAGTVTVYDAEGKVATTFKTGIIPGKIAFKVVPNTSIN